jgi:choline transport protein
MIAKQDLSGWLCALGWQSYVPGAGNICGSAIQGFAVVANSSYVPKTWQLVLLTIFICSFAILFNIFLARRLPGIEGAVFTLYALTFVALFIILLAMGPRSSAKEIFTDFQDNAGWGSIGTACFVGVSGPVITLIGADSSVHMAEELKDASKQLPRAMLSTAVVNYTLGFMMTVAFIAVLGNINEDIASPTGLPYVQVIWNATLSRAGTMTIVALIIFFFIFCAVNQNTTSSRQLYAFARDGGLPFSAWVSYVSFLRSQLRRDANKLIPQGLTHHEYSCQRRSN